MARELPRARRLVSGPILWATETFDMLMGDQVPPRKKFIQTHAKYVRNLDV